MPGGPVAALTPVAPANSNEWRAVALDVHQALGVVGPSERLTPAQLDRAFEEVGKRFGVSPQLLKYVANDAIANIAYGAKMRAETAKLVDGAFEHAGLQPPTDPRTRDLVIDFIYNRGPGLAEPLAKHAAGQGIDVNNFQEYFAGKGGTATIVKAEQQSGRFKVLTIQSHQIEPGPGVDKTGAGSPLDLALKATGVVNLPSSVRDLNRDGKRTHLDVWVQRVDNYDAMVPAAARAPSA